MSRKVFKEVKARQEAEMVAFQKALDDHAQQLRNRPRDFASRIHG